MATTSEHPRARIRRGLVILTAALVLPAASCSSGGSDAAPTTSAAPTTTEATTTVAPATTTTTPISADPVAPAELPEGHKALQAEGVGVGLAVPEGWEPLELDPDALTDAQKEAAEVSPELADALDAGAGALGDSTAIGVGETTDAGFGGLVTIIQTSLVLPTVPSAMASMLTPTLEQLGATNITTAALRAAGMKEGTQGLAAAADLEVDGTSTRMRLLLVPTSLGIALIQMRAPEAVADQMVASLAVR